MVLFCYSNSSDKVQDKTRILEHALQGPLSGLSKGRVNHKLLKSAFFFLQKQIQVQVHVKTRIGLQKYEAFSRIETKWIERNFSQSSERYLQIG